MLITISIIMICYCALVIFMTKRWVADYERELDDKASRMESSYQALLNKKSSFDLKKLELESEVVKIFTLYEITKEMTKTLHEEETFSIFKERLQKYIPHRECLFEELYNEDIKVLGQDMRNYLFPVLGKERTMGFLVVKGIGEGAKDHLAILGSQFALALRRAKLYQAIEKVAITDSLTEVYTRRHTLERFQEEISRGKTRKIKLSFLMIDVDFFKTINDQFGHLTGDQVLKETAGIIKDNIREIDIAGRYGGEEFCIILPDTDREGAQLAAQRIRVAAENKTIKAYDASVKVTLSIGVSTFPDDGKAVPELIDKADWALYRAKKQGRNRVCAFGVYEG